MKITHKLSIIIIGIFMLAASQPEPVAALSCLAPSEHIPMIVTDGNYAIFTGEITAARESEGTVTELDIAVTETLQGSLSGTTTVQYEYDDTWGYLCAGAPSEVGVTETFVVRASDTETPYVTYSFSTDSDLYDVLMDSLSGTKTATTTTPIEPEPNETERDLLFQVIELLEELLSLLRLR